jgi:leader peptidase (prepilin peptidase) / N-methyltransferase
MISLSVNLFLLLLVAVLVVISYIDIRSQIIPDAMNGMLVGVGMSYQLVDGNAFWGALSGLGYFALFYGIRTFHRGLTGRIGLGLGDVKMAGAAGTWLPATSISLFLMLAAFAALAAVIALRFCRNRSFSERLPFAPFLSLSLLLCWLLSVSDYGGGIAYEF